MIGMDIKTQLSNSMKDAMKSGDEVRKRTTRMALANIKQVEVDKRTALDDAAVISLLQKDIKNRREAVEEAKKANRADLIADNEAEIKVIESFPPQSHARRGIEHPRPSRHCRSRRGLPCRYGQGHEGLLPKVAGRAAGDQVSAVVKELLAE